MEFEGGTAASITEGRRLDHGETLDKHGLGGVLHAAGKFNGATMRLWSAIHGMSRSAATVLPRSQQG